MKSNMLSWYNLFPVQSDTLINTTVEIYLHILLPNGDTINFCNSVISFDENGMPRAYVTSVENNTNYDSIYYTFDKKERLIKQTTISNNVISVLGIKYFKNSIVATTHNINQGDTSVIIETFNYHKNKLKSYKIESFKTCEFSSYEYFNDNLTIANLKNCNSNHGTETLYIINLPNRTLINFSYPRGDSEYTNILYNDSGSISQISYTTIYSEPVIYEYMYDTNRRISKILCYKNNLCKGQVATQLKLESVYKFVYRVKL
ncbi:MAG: hypothetical protein WAT43_19135 [Chitinophagales bacterium]